MACTRETTATVSKEEELLTCPICLQLFSEPMSLPCSHTYCLPCLETMSAGLDRNNCPECQQEYSGTGALVKNTNMCSKVEAHKVSLGRNNNESQSSSDCAKETTPTEFREETRPRETASAPSRLDSSTCQSKHPQKNSPLEGQECPRAEFDSSGPRPLPTSPEQQSITTKKTEMDEPKFRLASQLTELTVRLEMAESVLKKETQLQQEASAANEELRGGTAALLHAIRALTLDYSEAVTRLIEGELSPAEDALGAQVSRAARLSEELRHCVLSAESLLTEEDEAAFTQDLDLLQPRIALLMGRPPAEDVEPDVEPDGGGGSQINTSRACAKLEEMNTEFKAGMGDVHRKLRNALNPSEVTFDPDTAHPNLVLSGDMKTVTYSAVKRPYPASPRRFTNLLQVLSSQSFYGGEHRWRVQLEGSPWVVGVCYSDQLERSGLPSALESSRSSWCLMWFENRLRAFERGHEVPLKLTALSRTLEVRLSFRTHRLSFYDVGPSGGKTHVYTFKVQLTGPVHLAYRMLSGDVKARVTIGEA